MFTHVTKTHNRVCAILCAFLCLAGVLVYTSTPVFASGQSVGQIDADIIGTNAMTVNIQASQSAFYIGDDMSELRVPITIRFVNGADISPYSFTYLSGISRYNLGINMLGVDTNSPINVNPAYFEGVHTRKNPNAISKIGTCSLILTNQLKKVVITFPNEEKILLITSDHLIYNNYR